MIPYKMLLLVLQTHVESETDLDAHSYSTIEDLPKVIEQNIALVILKLEHSLCRP